MAIGAAGDLVFVHRVDVKALDGFNRKHALMLGLVREHGRASDIANGIDACDIGFA